MLTDAQIKRAGRVIRQSGRLTQAEDEPVQAHHQLFIVLRKTRNELLEVP